MSFNAETMDGQIVEIVGKAYDAERNSTILTDSNGNKWVSSADEAQKLQSLEAVIASDVRTETLMSDGEAEALLEEAASTETPSEEESESEEEAAPEEPESEEGTEADGEEA